MIRTILSIMVFPALPLVLICYFGPRAHTNAQEVLLLLAIAGSLCAMMAMVEKPPKSKP